MDYATGDAPDAEAVADVNGDGKPDVVTANGSASTVSVLLNSTP
jgi:FG-GAP repeat